MNAAELLEALAGIQLESVFNPYRDQCIIHDRPNAPIIRRANLRSVVDAAVRLRVESLWVARDLGYRGGRRTGLPLTDETNLTQVSLAYGGITLTQATLGLPMAERTAGVVWKLLSALKRPVFLWNIFPLHPFIPGNPLSNRPHSKREREHCIWLLETLLEALQPARIVAIGRDADSALRGLGVSCYGVRHPSYGGITDFEQGISGLYGLRFCPNRHWIAR